MLVDYNRAARQYRNGRALSGDVLERWRRAVVRYLPPHVRHVADIGAGTGIFARAWPGWCSGNVVAVEPCAAMVAAGGCHAGYVRGMAEALPLRAGSVEVVWASTALHHFFDLPRAIREFDRVLARGGRVLVRTHLPERTTLGALHRFPGHERALARFPRLGTLTAAFSDVGYSLVGVEDVVEGTHSFGASADWVERMRHADSMLTALTDDELEEGLRRLRAEPDRRARLELSLVVFAH